MRFLPPAVAALLASLNTPAFAGRPAAGSLAPAFSLPASTGKTIALAEFRGKRTVVLAFFPKAFTGG